MPASRDQILQNFLDYTEGRMPLVEFQEWVAVTNWQEKSSIPPELVPMIHAAVGKLAEFSRGHRTEEDLRAELAKAIRPFRYAPK